jgi:hypothetical protein
MTDPELEPKEEASEDKARLCPSASPLVVISTAKASPTTGLGGSRPSLLVLVSELHSPNHNLV